MAMQMPLPKQTFTAASWQQSRKVDMRDERWANLLDSFPAEPPCLVAPNDEHIRALGVLYDTCRRMEGSTPMHERPTEDEYQAALERAAAALGIRK